jgi:hypothetical protein
LTIDDQDAESSPAGSSDQVKADEPSALVPRCLGAFLLLVRSALVPLLFRPFNGDFILDRHLPEPYCLIGQNHNFFK